MTYDTLAYIAETWGLLWLAGMFAVALLYALWPGNRQKFRHAAQIPLQEAGDCPAEAGPSHDRRSAEGDPS